MFVDVLVVRTTANLVGDGRRGPSRACGEDLSDHVVRPAVGEIEVVVHVGVVHGRVHAEAVATVRAAGADVVQLYAHDVVGSVTRPSAQLLGYQRRQTKQKKYQQDIGAKLYTHALL